MKSIVNDSCLICGKPGLAVMCRKCLTKYRNSPAYSVKLARATDKKLYEAINE